MKLKTTPTLISLLTIAVIVVLAVILMPHGTKKMANNTSTASLTSLSVKPAPWPPEYDHLANRLQAIKMHLLSAEGSAEHIHAHLDIFINGSKVSVPADIGIPPSGGITPIHTHDTSGIIHIESPIANAQYTLGQFFDVWGVKLTDNSIGAYADNTSSKLTVYDNGQPVSDPTSLVLKAHHEIAVVYGTVQQQSSVPSTYNFPSGL